MAKRKRDSAQHKEMKRKRARSVSDGAKPQAMRAA